MAMGSLLGMLSSLVTEFVSPVAPTRLAKPPRGTLELRQGGREGGRKGGREGVNVCGLLHTLMGMPHLFMHTELSNSLLPIKLFLTSR